jgi:hypothetical protein
MNREKLIGMIENWLKDNAKDLSTEELNKIIHFCNGGDAIHSKEKIKIDLADLNENEFSFFSKILKKLKIKSI